MWEADTHHFDVGDRNRHVGEHAGFFVEAYVAQHHVELQREVGLQFETHFLKYKKVWQNL